jgi:hypothetical protein
LAKGLMSRRAVTKAWSGLETSVWTREERASPFSARGA